MFLLLFLSSFSLHCDGNKYVKGQLFMRIHSLKFCDIAQIQPIAIEGVQKISDVLQNVGAFQSVVFNSGQKMRFTS